MILLTDLSTVLYALNVNLGRTIQHTRKVRKISLRTLARTLKVDPSYLSRVEAGKVPASDVLVRSAAKALGVDPEEWLLLSGRIPRSWQKAIATSPDRIVRSIRRVFADSVAEAQAPYGPTVLAFEGTRAIENETFPFEQLSDIAEMESWRKEVYRPIYHLHKWWAQRLGSVFRAILLGTFAPKGSNLLEMFYQPARLSNAVIFDPFMGSGTTVGEALKLGAKVIGRDINPVAHFAVQNALRMHDRRKVIDTFQAIEHDVAPLIQRYYRAHLPRGITASVLYYFWVKVIPCPKCSRPVDLFSSYVFAKHAYPVRNPQARAICRHCGSVNSIRYDLEKVTCKSCHKCFNPQLGPAKGTTATCSSCAHSFLIIKAVQSHGGPPGHRIYAKMVLKADGSKEYLAADEYDRSLYEEASRTLARRKNAFPLVPIEPGYNTNQVLNYCYRYWHQMFNDRQLLCLSFLADRIRAIPNEELQGLFTCLFSATLEFNNMFTSFKGEGTGAVRHMFSHHILKPERTPLEANLWGTPKSSGAFSTLFESRLLRALDYCENPFELRVSRANGKLAGEKVYGLSPRLGYDMAVNFDQFQDGRMLYLSCGDSAKTDIPSWTVDAVVTDPPFFDNVHYSQLADFFHVWQRHILGKNGHHASHSTRSAAEVQHSEPMVFTERLQRVWAECYRVLRPHGLLVFTYHHSRPEGWKSLLEALFSAGFVIVAAHPIKSEMSVAMPKQQAKEPIDLDVILVCRKREAVRRNSQQLRSVMADSVDTAADQVCRLNAAGRKLSRNDVRVILTAQVIARLSRARDASVALKSVEELGKTIERQINSLCEGQKLIKRPTGEANIQLGFFANQVSS